MKEDLCIIEGKQFNSLVSGPRKKTVLRNAIYYPSMKVMRMAKSIVISAVTLFEDSTFDETAQHCNEWETVKVLQGKNGEFYFKYEFFSQHSDATLVDYYEKLIPGETTTFNFNGSPFVICLTPNKESLYIWSKEITPHLIFAV